MWYIKVGDRFMKCENCFCIYQEDNFCILESVELDNQGQCKECICLDLEEELLCDLKRRKRESLLFKE